MFIQKSALLINNVINLQTGVLYKESKGMTN